MCNYSFTARRKERFLARYLGVLALVEGFGLGIGFMFRDRDNTAHKICQTLKGSSVRQIRL
jgi:hypothetical protein